METGESGNEGRRKRTESSGESSDSELSEGWNLVYSACEDVNGHSSSDGESVEIIEAEDEPTDHVMESEVQSTSEPIAKPETPAALAHQGDAGTVSAEAPVPTEVVEPVQEEMFDSSFCWFLFFATSAMLISNLAFVAMENALDWNTEINVESPSFLRDLPITQKPTPQNRLPNVITWADNEEVTVDTFDDINIREQVDGEVAIPDNMIDDMVENSKQSNAIQQRKFLKIDNHEVGKYFNALSDTTGSAEAQNKFAQALLILDALHIGLKDLEEVVPDKSELHKVLQKQKDSLSNALSGVELGVSRSMERLATNILNRVQKLERRFENQWCKLESAGYKEELRGLFYDCQEGEAITVEKSSKNTKHAYKTKSKPDFNEKNHKRFNKKNNGHFKENNKKHFNENDRQFSERDGRKQAVIDGYQYEVDKDSTGKVYTKPGREDIGSGDYYKLLKNGKYSGEKHENFDNTDDHEKLSLKEGNASNEGKLYMGKHKDLADGKGKHFKDVNQNRDKLKKEPHNEDKPSNKYPYKMKSDISKSLNEAPQSKNEKGFVDKETEEIVIKFLKENCEKSWSIEHLSYVINEKVTIPPEIFRDMYTKYCLNDGDSFKRKKHTTDEFKYNDPDVKHDEPHAKPEKFTADNSAIEIVTKYLKENCVKNRIGYKTTKESNYHTLKDIIYKKVRIPSDMFNKMYERYCQFDGNGYKQEKQFKNQAKGDFSGKEKERRFKGASVIEDHKNYLKNVIEIRLMEESEKKGEGNQNGLGKEQVILPTDKPRQWTFAYESSFETNETNFNGDWFIKSGESRSKTRWLHHRGDWWFDRASYRRRNPQNWFASRHKNWFFRRAWARQQCRDSPNDGWCNSAEEETVTIPKTSSNFR